MNILYALQGLLFIAIGAIQLLRAYSGTASAGMLTLSHSDTVTLTSRSRRINGVLGVCFVGLGITNVVVFLLNLHRA
ncbi:MAG TPA: hypothetical protein VEW69_01170 [Alphaproteobacteria bacterium]|nr:hypothetical protein [Alphaproteobacteria bacterium]